MAHLDRKTVFDAGASKPVNQREIDDQGGEIVSTPRSAYAITETTNLIFTNDKILRAHGHKLDIADGDQRPGTA